MIMIGRLAGADPPEHRGGRRTGGADDPDPRAAFDTTVAHNARVWNYWLGGKDNYRGGRRAAVQVPQYGVVARKP